MAARHHGVLSAVAVVGTTVVYGIYNAVRRSSSCTPGEDFCFDLDLLTDLGTGNTFSSAKDLNIAADGNKALSNIYADNIHRFTDICDLYKTPQPTITISNFADSKTTNSTTSLVEMIPSWQKYLLIIAALFVLGPLLYTFAPTRARLGAVADRVKSQVKAIWDRVPLPVRAFVGRVCDWYCNDWVALIAGVLALFSFEEDELPETTEYIRLSLAIILAFIFSPSQQPQALPDNSDGNNPAGPAGGAGGLASPPPTPSNPPAGGNPQVPPTVPQLPDSNSDNRNQDDSESPSDDDGDEQWFDAPEEPTADDEPSQEPQPAVSNPDTNRSGHDQATLTDSKGVQTEDDLTAFKIVWTDDDHFASIGVQTDDVSVHTKEEQDSSEQQENDRQEEAEKLRDGLDATQADLEQSKKTIKQLRQENAVLKDALKDTKQALDRAKRCYEASERSNSRIQQSCNEVSERRREDEAGVARLVARTQEESVRHGEDREGFARVAARAQEESIRHRLEIISLRNTNSNNEIQIKDLLAQIKELDRALADAGDRAKAANSTIELNDGAISDKQAACISLQSALEDEKKKRENDQMHQNAKYKALETKHKNFARQAREYVVKQQQKIDDAVNAVQEQSKQTIRDLRVKLEESESAATSTKKDLASVKQGRDALLKDKTAADKIAKDTMTTLRDEKIELSDQLASAKSNNQKLENEIEELKKRIAALEAAKSTSTAALPAPTPAPATASTGDASTPALGPSSNFRPPESVQDKPAGSNATPAPASLKPSPLAPVFDSTAGHGASTPANGFAMAFSKAPENANGKPAGSVVAPVSAPVASGLVTPNLAHLAGDGASTPVGGLATRSKAPENANGRPAGADGSANLWRIQPPGHRGRGNANPLGGGFNAIKKAPKPSRQDQAANRGQQTRGAPTAPAPDAGDSMDGVEKASGRPKDLPIAPDPFFFAPHPVFTPLLPLNAFGAGSPAKGNAKPFSVPENVPNKPLGLYSEGPNGTAVLPGLTPLFPQNGFGVGAGGLPPHTLMSGVKNTPPTQPHRTPEFLIDPQLLGQQTGNGAATGAPKPDVEMGESENVPTATLPANPQQDHYSASTLSLLAIQISKKIGRLETELATLEKKRKSKGEEVDEFTARHEVAHSEEVGITRASLNAAESALRDLDDQIQALKDQIKAEKDKLEDLRRRLASNHTGGQPSKRDDDDDDDGTGDGGFPGSGNSGGDAMDTDRSGNDPPPGEIAQPGPIGGPTDTQDQDMSDDSGDAIVSAAPAGFLLPAQPNGVAANAPPPLPPTAAGEPEIPHAGPAAPTPSSLLQERLRDLESKLQGTRGEISDVDEKIRNAELDVELCEELEDAPGLQEANEELKKRQKERNDALSLITFYKSSIGAVEAQLKNDPSHKDGNGGSAGGSDDNGNTGGYGGMSNSSHGKGNALHGPILPLRHPARRVVQPAPSAPALFKPVFTRDRLDGAERDLAQLQSRAKDLTDEINSLTHDIGNPFSPLAKPALKQYRARKEEADKEAEVVYDQIEAKHEDIDRLQNELRIEELRKQNDGADAAARLLIAADPSAHPKFLPQPEAGKPFKGLPETDGAKLKRLKADFTALNVELVQLRQSIDKLQDEKDDYLAVNDEQAAADASRKLADMKSQKDILQSEVSELEEVILDLTDELDPYRGSTVSAWEDNAGG